MILELNEYRIVLGLITAFLVTYAAIPSIIKIVEIKNLYDIPEARKSHKDITPTLGGLAIFAGFLIAVSIWIDSVKTTDFQYIVAASIVVFFIGLKDDILMIAPITKLTGQIFSALIVVVLGDMRFTHLHGFFHQLL